MMSYSRDFAVLLFIVFFATTWYVRSQTLPMVNDPPAPYETIYSSQIPTPEELLGHRIGEKHTRPHQIVSYFRSIAQISDRVEYGEHGFSHDGRPLIHAIITAPENHERINEIREKNLRLSLQSSDVRDDEIETMPAIIWMGYGVHGNEASGFETAILLLYHLAAGEGERLERMLRDLVIILIPSLNPDGHSRHVNWVNSNRGATPTTDPQSREHNEPWPGGRTNYYWFDLNRDWLPLQHPESQGRMKLYNQWRPQLVTDFHEFGSHATYFFQPGVASRYHPHIPETGIQLLKTIGEFHESALDERGVLYYTRETFDDFFIGKGSTYPMVTGAVGILFEQASSRALMRETQRGLLTFERGILNQFSTSISTLEASSQLRQSLLRYQRDFYREARNFARNTGVRAYVVDMQTDRIRAQELIRILQRHRIEVYNLRQPVETGGQRFVPDSSFIIPTEQTEARLIVAAMERRTQFADSIFYDVSTWTLPLAFNLPYAEISRDPRNLLGEQIAHSDFNAGIYPATPPKFAYLMEWNSYFAPGALYQLQNHDLLTMVATQPFTIMINREERTFSRGTIIIPVQQERITRQHLHELIIKVGQRYSVEVYGVDSGRAIQGPDLGSPANRVLGKPHIALLAGEGTSPTEVGEVWHLLSRRMGIPVTLLNIDAILSADLSRYTTLIMVNGRYHTLTSSHFQKIREWVEKGGVLITTKQATRLAMERDLLRTEIIEADIDLGDVDFENVAEARGAHHIGGSIFEASLDITHPVAFGYRKRVPLFRNHTNVFKPSNVAGEMVAVYSDEPLLSGYISNVRLEQIRNSGAIFAQRVGNGRLLSFADNPNFRAFWHGTNGLFLNAIFFGGII